MNFTNMTGLEYQIVEGTTTNINVMDVFRDVCNGVDDFVYKGIVMIFIFYVSARVMLPTVDLVVEREFPSFSQIWKTVSSFYFSLTETLALSSITLVLILNTFYTTGTYHNVWIYSALAIVVSSFFIRRKYKR